MSKENKFAQYNLARVHLR